MPHDPKLGPLMKRYWPWMAGGMAVLAVAVTAWLLLRAPRVDVLEITQEPLVRTLQFSARVATLSRVDVGSTVTGRVAQVLVQEGAQVRKGQVLVQLESDELRAAVAQAVATENQAAARIAGLRSSGRSSAQAGLAQADSTLKAAQAELLRTQQLIAQGFVSASRLDDALRRRKPRPRAMPEPMCCRLKRNSPWRVRPRRQRRPGWCKRRCQHRPMRAYCCVRSSLGRSCSPAAP
jgi:multidrug efflux pump subunit AcrA (membrane-fusion protein)